MMNFFSGFSGFYNWRGHDVCTKPREREKIRLNHSVILECRDTSRYVKFKRNDIFYLEHNELNDKRCIVIDITHGVECDANKSFIYDISEPVRYMGEYISKCETSAIKAWNSYCSPIIDAGVKFHRIDSVDDNVIIERVSDNVIFKVPEGQFELCFEKIEKGDE